MTLLSEKKCTPHQEKVAALSKDDIAQMILQLKGWAVDAELKSISRRFEFKSYAKTLAFVNAIAWIATEQAHHPEIQFGYNFCLVHFSTHAAQGLTENDFICAAKVDRLLE